MDKGLKPRDCSGIPGAVLLDDFSRWKAEHQRGKETLQRMLAELDGDDRLSRHVRKVEAHGRTLANLQTDLASMDDSATLRTDMERGLGPKREGD